LKSILMFSAIAFIFKKGNQSIGIFTFEQA
jgi:hypothetical protein